MATRLFSWVLTKRNCIERKAKIWLKWWQQQQLLVTAAAALQQVNKKNKEEQISLQDPINQPWNIS
jgi:hypothetical protein